MARKSAPATLGVVLLLIPACRSILGVTGYGTGTEAVEAGPSEVCPAVTDAGDACTMCVANRCCTEASACDQEPACRAMKGCVAACSGSGDHPCRALCNQSIPRTPEWGELVACEANRCRTCPGSLLIRAGTACDECLAGSCSREMNALSRDETAVRLDSCRKDCPTASADADARAASGCSCSAHAKGAPLLDAADECEKAHCDDLCNPPVDWSCLGHVQWPNPAVRELELHVGAVDASNFFTPVRSFNVAACGNIDGPCDTPLVTGKGSNGWAELTIPRPLPPPSFFQYLLVTTGDVDALFYFFPPVRRSPFWSERRLVNRQFAESTVSGGPLGPLGIKIDWNTKGGIVWSVTSCGDPSPFAEGVTVSSFPDVPTYYFDAQGNLAAGQATSSFGIGAMINVIPGDYVLSASTTPDAGSLKVGIYPVRVIAGKLTHVTMAPL